MRSTARTTVNTIYYLSFSTHQKFVSYCTSLLLMVSIIRGKTISRPRRSGGKRHLTRSWKFGIQLLTLLLTEALVTPGLHTLHFYILILYKLIDFHSFTYFLFLIKGPGRVHACMHQRTKNDLLTLWSKHIIIEHLFVQQSFGLMIL